MIDLIAEWGPPGSLDRALRQLEATKRIGASYAKWQLFDPDLLASRDARRYWSDELGGPESQHDLFRGTGSLTEPEWFHLFTEARDEAGIEPMVSPFDVEAVDLLEAAGLDAYKIASGDITHRRLLERVNATGKRVCLSTGATNEHEVQRALKWLKDCEVIPMACDLVYPCHAKDADLARHIPAFRGFEAVGFSDHTREVVTGAVAVALGATVLEKHVTLDPGGETPDDAMALTVDQAKTYLMLARQAKLLCAEVVGDPEREARIGARRSAYAARTLAAGHVLSEEDVVWLRPCPPGAIDASSKVAGKTLAEAVEAGQRIESEAVV